uniref:Ig-like domain-containing protein n=1 Tax=Serinus canaria TaxID=9135 RepID=A0A8C9MZF4_SERCA
RWWELIHWAFPGAASDSVALKEGENLNLNCTFSSPSSNNFTLQWLNPRNFTIFLNAQQGKYQLLRYAQGELSIQLSNLSQQDEGTYRCLHYTRHVQTKRQKVEILAAPSPPELELSQGGGRGVQLCCHSQGGRPQPQISWLLDGGIEVPGESDTRHQLGADGKSWSTRSTLRILNYSPGVTASCIIQHPALGPRSLVATFPFQDLPSSGSAAQPPQFHCPELGKCPSPPRNAGSAVKGEAWGRKRASRPSEDAEVPRPSENPAVSSSSENPAGTSPSASPENPELSNPSASPGNPELSNPSATPGNPELSNPSASPGNPELSNPSASPENPELSNPSASPENPELSSPSASPGNPELSNPSASPGNPELSNPSASPGNPELSSPSASPNDLGVSSPSASPENPEICNPSASPKDPEDSGPSATPGNPELSSPSASPKDPGISSPSASPKDPELSSPSASPENPEVSSPSACPGNPAAPSSAPALTDVTLHGEFGLSPLSLSRLK